MLDDRTITRSDIDPRPHRIWSVPSNAFAWRAYVGPAAGSDTVDVRAVPSRRADLTGLPAAWIGVGTADLFHDEDTTYGARLRAAGVPCALHVVQGGFHAFDVAVRAAPVSRAFRAAWQEAIARAIAPA
jgi:acetyl esterase/lipase